MTVQKLLYWLFKISPRLAFKFEYTLVMQKLQQSINPLYSFPVLVFMKFGQREMYEKFMRGISIRRQVNIKISAIKRSVNRIANPPSNDVMERYHQYCSKIRARMKHIDNMMKIDKFISKFPDYKPNPELFEDEFEEVHP